MITDEDPLCCECCNYLQHTGEFEAVLEVLPVAFDIRDESNNFWSCNGHDKRYQSEFRF